VHRIVSFLGLPLQAKARAAGLRRPHVRLWLALPAARTASASMTEGTGQMRQTTTIEVRLEQGQVAGAVPARPSLAPLWLSAGRPRSNSRSNGLLGWQITEMDRWDEIDLLGSVHIMGPHPALPFRAASVPGLPGAHRPGMDALKKFGDLVRCHAGGIAYWPVRDRRDRCLNRFNKETGSEGCR
jgi:hypothetical protein